MFRVIQDGPLDGPTNMARDEALLESVGAGASPPTLRLYQWNPPTISLGYFQAYADYVALEPPAGDLAVVRRTTGGGAILHDLELTYALAVPIGHEWLSDGANKLYQKAHDAAIASLAMLGFAPEVCGMTDDSGAARGPFFCFARRHRFDLVVGHDKIVGSAQRRTKLAILQHGSIVLGNRFMQQPTAQTDVPFEKAIAHVRASFVEHLIGTGAQSNAAGQWTVEELDRTCAIYEKYAGSEWTRRV